LVFVRCLHPRRFNGYGVEGERPAISSFGGDLMFNTYIPAASTVTLVATVGEAGWGGTH